MPHLHSVPARNQTLRHGFMLWLFCLSLVLALPPQAALAQTNADPRLLHLLTLMQQRLVLAKDVAMYKWNAKVAIDDPVREQQILDALAKQAPQYGLTPDMAQGFFNAQIVAGKMIQVALFADWQKQQQASFAKPPDLKTQIRPALDQLTTALLTALADARPVLQSTAGQQALELAAQAATSQAEGQAAMPGYAKAWQYVLDDLRKTAVP
ncbi:gamma subclass chorismate mutase AroQ [Undibacterium sp. TJN19]|uniref:gamma subclass chorismate mutase AroQ n=1 Tax=Undibacterium sp. TJN19 TaxID=3413055 RepID=UPI003BEFA771